MNKFAEWMKNKNQKQCGVAAALRIGQSTLHDILKKGQLPKLKLAYAIEVYTGGKVTLYDWFDYSDKKNKKISTHKIAPKAKKNKK